MHLTNLDPATQLLVDRNYLGLVWIDRYLIAVSKVGQLADNVALDQNICESLIVLANLENEIYALRDDPSRPPIELANVGMQSRDRRTERLNYVLTWNDDATSLLLTIARPIAASDNVIALHRQTRLTMMAEAEVARQARAIQQANNELAEANANLEEFTRIITHDLKAPMRAMRYFADDLEYALVGRENSEAMEHLDKLRGQSRRMSLMVSSLLSYTHLENTSDDIEELDTSALLDEIIGSLPIPNDFVIEKLGIWPRIPTLRAPLDLILRNLMQNAIQHHDNVVGCIKVNCEQIEDELRIRVTDDGPGIPSRFRDAVFNPFTSLTPHGSEQSGMGLTLVKRAAERIGARLSLLETPDDQRGTTFELYWPMNIAAK